MARYLVVSVLLFSGGCVVAPSQEQLTDAEARNLYGSRPDPGPIVSAYLHANLKDPYSVQDLAIGSLEKSWILTRQDILRDRQYVWCWRCIVRYNAKNSFGAYVGIRAYRFYMRADSGVLAVEG
jgi:hypothetical protein